MKDDSKKVGLQQAGGNLMSIGYDRVFVAIAV